MTSPPSFDLLTEPWVRVRTHDGQVAELSLIDTLSKAPDLRALAGELPTQDAAVLRLLLAIVLGATRPTKARLDDVSVDLWETWWHARALPMDVVLPYLEAHRERFDLLHGRTPFLQVAGLTTDSGKRSGLGKLIADLPDGHPFFTTRAGQGARSLSLPEATRWLVHCQAFDPSGIKTGAAGDARVKGGKGYPFGYPAWAGNLGLVIAEGNNLAETLLLNLPLTMTGPDDLPVWERAPLGPGVEIPTHEPTGPADLYSWPSRRLRLFVEGERVVDVQISNGDRLAPQNLHPFEPMSAWRISANQSKAGDVYMPVLHQPSRRVWQGLGAILQRDEHGGTKPAQVVEWLARLEHERVLTADRPIDLHIVGFSYGTQNSVIDGAIDDRLTAPVAALTDLVLVGTALAATEAARQGVAALVNLASNLARAGGLDGEDGTRDSRREVGFALLDQAFRRWVLTLTDPSDTESRSAAWSSEAFGLLTRAGQELIREAGPTALVGRQLPKPNGGGTELRDAGKAEILFKSALRKAFPQRQSDQEETDD